MYIYWITMRYRVKYLLMVQVHKISNTHPFFSVHFSLSMFQIFLTQPGCLYGKYFSERNKFNIRIILYWIFSSAEKWETIEKYKSLIKWSKTPGWSNNFLSISYLKVKNKIKLIPNLISLDAQCLSS